MGCGGTFFVWQQVGSWWVLWLWSNVAVTSRGCCCRVRFLIDGIVFWFVLVYSFGLIIGVGEIVTVA